MHWNYRGNRQKAGLLLRLTAAALLLLVWPEESLVQRIYEKLCPYAVYCMDAVAYGREGSSVETRIMDMVSQELPLYSYSISYYGNGMMNEYYKEYVELLMRETGESGMAELEEAAGDGQTDTTEEEMGIVGSTKNFLDKIFGNHTDQEKESTAGQGWEDGGNTGEDAGGQRETDQNAGENAAQAGESDNGGISGTGIAESEETAINEAGNGEQRLNEENSNFIITDGGSVDKTVYQKLIHREKQQDISLEDYQEFEELISKFYTVDSNTYTTAGELNAEKLSSVDMSLKKNSGGPQILIYHTHSQEGYADSVAGDASTTVVGVGEQLAEILRNEYGYQVLHHIGTYDVETREYAYSNALPELEMILAENPSIEVVIDLHRDSVSAETRLVTEIDGIPVARFMFFNGLSRVREVGEISYLPNENLQENLAFSFQMQKVCEEYYPGLTRKIYLKGYRYNMHVKPRTLLVELGAQNNTLQEAMNACGPLARVLDMVLGGE